MSHLLGFSPILIAAFLIFNEIGGSCPEISVKEREYNQDSVVGSISTKTLPLITQDCQDRRAKTQK